MKTILTTLSNLVDNDVLATSSVWNYYNSGDFSDLLKNSRSNLHCTAVDLIRKNKAGHGITVVTGAKGWSAHSETGLIIFKGEVDMYFGAYFSFEELLSLTNFEI